MVKKVKKSEERIIMRVWMQKTNNEHLLVTIPKRSSIKVGDYVEIKKI